jgi:hypothetical protein
MRQYSTKWNLVKPIAKIYSQGFHRNLLPNFLSFRLFSMQYRSLPNFSAIFKPERNQKGKEKSGNSAWAGFGPRPCANGPAQQPILAQGIGATCVQSVVTPPVLTHDDPMPCSPAAHRRSRQRGVSGRSTYIEQLTHRAMWSC